MNTSFIRGFLKTAADETIKGGLADNKPSSKYDPEQIKKGLKVEKEHTPDMESRREISKDHLQEKENSKYYDYLPIAEKQPKATGLQKKVENFLEKNPSPSDDEFHSFAEQSGENKHKLESAAYALLGKYLGAKKEE